MDIFKMGDSNPNYLGNWDVPEKSTLILTIKSIAEETVVGNGGIKECCTVCHFVEDAKPMILNATNKKTLARLFGTKDDEQLKGKRIVIGVEKVKAFGDIFDALRIKKQHAPAANAVKIICEACQKEIAAANGLEPEQLAAYTKQKYGQQLCAACATAKANGGSNGTAK